jgi:hypothetical protein
MTHVVITGPITGTVTTADGTTYDVSADQIAVSQEHRQEVADLIGDRYASEGHPAHLYSDVPFEHVKTVDVEATEASTDSSTDASTDSNQEG